MLVIISPFALKRFSCDGATRIGPCRNNHKNVAETLSMALLLHSLWV